MDYVRVASEAELTRVARQDGAALLCGGTDLLVKIHAGTARPRLVVDISRIDSLRGVSVTPEGAVIGAAARISELLDSHELCAHYPLLATALRSLGSVQIRNRATLGGNLANASPAADSVPALLAYEARLALAGGDEERTLPLEEFLRGPGRTALRPGEYIRSLVVPAPRPDWMPFFHKVGRRRALTIAIASVAGLLAVRDGRVDEIRLAAGSVAPVPLRLRRVEQQATGHRIGAPLAQAASQVAAQDVAPIDDIRATAAYRRDVVGDLVARFLSSARPDSATSA